MKYLILIITIILLTACSDKKSENARNLINNSDYCLIYKYDSLSNDFFLFHIPSTDTIDYLKKILSFDGKFKKLKTISPNYRFDLITKDSIIGEIWIEQSTTPYLTIKSQGFEASRQLDYELGMYLGDIEQNVYSEKKDSILLFKSEGGANDIFCTFSKQTDSRIVLDISMCRNYKTENSKQDLASIIEQLEIYWKVANRNNDIKLSGISANIGPPLQYKDVLIRHLTEFKGSKEWLDYVSQNGKKPNYKLTAEIMLEFDVYKPFNDFLKSKGFEIVDISLEKIDLVSSELLEEHMLDNKTIIPMPHTVKIKIEKTDSNRLDLQLLNN